MMLSALGVTSVAKHLLDHRPHVVILESVDHMPPIAISDHEIQVAENAQVIGYRRLSEPEFLDEFTDSCRLVEQPGEDTHPCRGGQRAHNLGDVLGLVSVELHHAPSLPHDNHS